MKYHAGIEKHIADHYKLEEKDVQGIRQSENPTGIYCVILIISIFQYIIRDYKHRGAFGTRFTKM